MSRARPNRKPTFLWQGLLIVLPVVGLAAVGLFSLRQDKILARHEATQRAQVIADDLASRLWIMISSANDPSPSEPHAFQINSAGQLICPPPFEPAPEPEPLNRANLDTEQTRLWSAARSDEAAGHDLASSVKAYREFLGSNPPENFAATAHYALGLLLTRQGSAQAAAAEFNALLEKYPDAVGESGLALAPLAQLKLLELAASNSPSIALPHPVTVEVLCSNAVYQPTPLTPYYLNVIADQTHPAEAKQVSLKWQRLWQQQALARQLFAAATPHLPTPPALAVPLPLVETPAAQGTNRLAWLTNRPSAGTEAGAGIGPPRLFWFRAPQSVSTLVTDRLVSPGPFVVRDGDWLALRRKESATGCWFVCYPEADLGARVTALVNDTKQIPEYFGIGVEVAGKKLAGFAPDLRVWHEDRYMTKGGGQEKKAYSDELATDILASATKAQEGTSLLKVNVYLTSPSALYQRQSARTFWFGSLIAASAVAALIGLVAAWRAFYRQQQLSELKSNFVSSVSHELRAPIASVRLMAESLERGKISDAPKQQEYFHFIVQECRRLSALIENVLDFSRIEQGRKEYEFEPTDVIALTQQTVKLMEPSAAEKQVRLALALDGFEPNNVHPPLCLDGKAIQQALVNLMDNAIKHSPKGETVTVGVDICGLESAGPLPASDDSVTTASPACAAQPEPAAAPAGSGSTPSQARIRLWVEDHGEGIPAAEQEKIFERFYRCGSELRRETQGVGIGLSIVKHVVEAHGGRVLVRSAVGEGSRFTIELPMSLL